MCKAIKWSAALQLHIQPQQEWKEELIKLQRSWAGHQGKHGGLCSTLHPARNLIGYRADETKAI